MVLAVSLCVSVFYIAALQAWRFDCVKPVLRMLPPPDVPELRGCTTPGFWLLVSPRFELEIP